MGAWNVGIYDNSIAGVFIWKVVDKAFEVAEDNEEYLVIADLLVKYGATNNEEIIKKVKKVIEEELKEESIINWIEEIRGRRKALLNNLLEKVNKYETDYC